MSFFYIVGAFFGVMAIAFLIEWLFGVYMSWPFEE